MIFVLISIKTKQKKTFYVKCKKKNKILNNICYFRQKNIKICISNLKCKTMFILYIFSLKFIKKQCSLYFKRNIYCFQK